MADYLKIPEVARRLDVSEKTARRYVKDGTLPSVFIGGAYRVSEEDLKGYLQDAKVQPGKAPGPAQLELEEQGGADEERRLLKLIQPWVLLMETETVYWELLVSKGLVNRHFYQEARARREDRTEHLNTLLEDLAEEGFDWENRRHRPSRRVRKKLQSTFNHWSWAFNAVGEAFFESLEGDELEEARALRDEDEAQEERLGDIYEILQARKTG